MKTVATAEFRDWLGSLSENTRAFIRDRLERIRHDNFFGDMKALGDGLYELRWRNGIRTYFAFATDSDGRVALMLLGGMKDGQDRDIRKARTLLYREGV